MIVIKLTFLFPSHEMSAVLLMLSVFGALGWALGRDRGYGSAHFPREKPKTR